MWAGGGGGKQQQHRGGAGGETEVVGRRWERRAALAYMMGHLFLPAIPFWAHADVSQAGGVVEWWGTTVELNSQPRLCIGRPPTFHPGRCARGPRHPESPAPSNCLPNENMPEPPQAGYHPARGTSCNVQVAVRTLPIHRAAEAGR